MKDGSTMSDEGEGDVCHSGGLDQEQRFNEQAEQEVSNEHAEPLAEVGRRPVKGSVSDVLKPECIDKTTDAEQRKDPEGVKGD